MEVETKKSGVEDHAKGKKRALQSDEDGDYMPSRLREPSTDTLGDQGGEPVMRLDKS
jgi:hypothetical protein